ncbi:hypothetical protein [Ferrovibrio sp.]|uniref:hypothetical protein n=1 Tax=Ferrovibrio sp. TaxID=1917215 RepID=UPI0035AD828B
MGWQSGRTILIFAQAQPQDRPKPGDNIYFEIPSGIEEIETLRTEVHLFLFDRADRDFNFVGAAIGHLAVDRDHLIEFKRQVGTVGLLDGKIVDQWRIIAFKFRIARHEEVDHHIDGGTVIAGGYATHQLKLPLIFTLSISMFSVSTAFEDGDFSGFTSKRSDLVDAFRLGWAVSFRLIW